MTRALYAINPGEVLAEACAVFDVNLHGLLYRAPVGVGVGEGQGTNRVFSYTALYIMGSHDFTYLELDKDNDGIFEEGRYLDAGEAWFVNGGVLAGATVKGSKAFQCHLVTGDIGSTYEMRWFELWPEDKWGSDYYSPIGSRIDKVGAVTNLHPAITYFFNPGTNAITIFYETRVSTGSFSVAAGSVSDSFTMPLDSGGRFYTTNGAGFLGVLVFDTWYNGAVLYGYVQHCQRYDWGMGLVPRNTLTTMGLCSWGPGYGTTAPGTNGNPIWVTAVSNTTVYVDFDSDPATGPLTDPLGNRYDFATNVSYLQSVQIFNNAAPDQTRMRFYTLDGVQLAAAWGADPLESEPGNPYLDMGYNILPFPTVLARKYATLFTDNNANGYPDPGDALEFMVDVINVGFATANSVIFKDDLPTNLTIYVNNSSYLNGIPVPDDLPPRPTRFPFDGSGYNIGTIAIGQTSVVRYLTTITATLPPNFTGYIHNNATVAGTNANWSAVGFTNILVGGLALYKTSSPTNPIDPGGTILYTLTLANTGQFTYTGVTLEDYLPLGVAYVAHSTVIQAPGGLTNTFWDRFNKPTFTNNNGTLNWLNDWQEFGESDGAAAGKVRVTPDTNSVYMESYALVVCGSNAAAWRAANLSGHSAAWLSFKYRRDSLPDINRYVDVFISTDGWASSNFLGRFQGAATDTNFISTNVEVSAWISTNTAIRFHSSSAPNMGLTNRVWFDDVKIEGVGSNVVFAGNPPPVLFEGLTLPPGTSIVARFSVTVDNPPLSTQLVNTARARAQQYDTWLHAQATNLVHATSGVSMVKSVVPPGLVAPGTNLAYTITLINTGNVSQTGITLNDYLPVGVTYVPGSATLARNYLHTNTVADLFNFKTYTNQDGLVDWSAAWTETGDDGTPTSGVIQVAVDNNVFPGRTYALSVTGANVSIQRGANLLAGYTNAVLSYEYRRHNLDAAGDTLTLQVSSNGGATWSAALATIAGPGTDSSYTLTNVSINAWISSNTAIRFLSSATVSAGNAFWLDSVRIAFSGASATNRLRNPPELLDSRYVLPPGRTMTIRLNALVDDPPASTQMVNTVCYRSDQQPDCRYAYATNTQDGSIGATIAKTSDITSAWGLYVTNTYTITVVNTGVVTLTSVKVTDLLPTGVTYVAGSTRIIGPVWSTSIVVKSVTTSAVSFSVRDEFNAQAYTNDNSTGGARWGGNWLELVDADGPLAGNVQVEASWNSFVLRAFQVGRGATREVGLGGYTNTMITNAVLSFDFRAVGLDAGEWIGAYVRTNPAATWAQVWGRTNLSDAATFSTNIPITAYASTGAAVRFYVGAANLATEGGRWDNVNIAFQGLQLTTNLGERGWITVTNQGGAPPTLATNYTLLPGSNLVVTFKATLNTPLIATQFINTATMTSTQMPPRAAWATNFAVPVAVGNWVWFDANTNGIQDIGEQGISNVPVRLYTGTTNLVATTNTSGTGYYLFSGWPAGNYFVEFVKPTGYWFTARYQGGDPALDSDADPVTGRTAITNLVSGTNLTLDAGLYVPPSSIGDWVWFDANTNGLQDVGEPGVTGVVVRLYNSATNLLATTTNNATGYYSFPGLPAGSYFVEFAIPTQYVFTLANQGGDPALDSDANPVNGRTAIFSLGTGTNDLRWDAGVIYPVQGLFITKASDLAGCGAPGGTATYTIVVRNTNIFTQTGVTVSDPAPSGATWLTNSIVIQAPSSGYTGVPPTLAYGYTLAEGQAMTVTVKAVISTPTASTQLLNTAYAYSAGNPAVQASVTNCLTSADLAVAKTANDSEVIEVQVVEYTVTVTNRGPNAATGVQITDVLPSTLQYNSHSNGTFSSGIWTIGSLPAFGSTSLYINVTVREGTAKSYITNGACVTASQQYDPVSTNNCAENIIRVTMIVLARFEGLNIGGQVALEWETVAEIGTVGFHLHRRAPDGSEAVQVTPDLLPAVVGAPQGGIYRFVDPTAEPGRLYLYELEEIEAGGSRIRYGPFEVRAPAGKRSRSAAIAEPFTSEVRASAFREERRRRAATVGARPQLRMVSPYGDTTNMVRSAPVRAYPPGERRPYTRRAADSGWPRLKIVISQTGLHLLGADELAAAAGEAVEDVRDAIGRGEVHLSRQGETRAWYPASDNGGLYFFAPALDSPFTTRDVYWVDWTNGLLMEAAGSGTPGAEPASRSFESTIHSESNITPITYYAESVYDDYWIWRSLSAPKTESFVLNVADPAGGIRPTSLRSSLPRAELTAWLWGATATGRTNEHTVTLRLNGQPLATEVWSGVGRRHVAAALDPALLRHGANTVTVSAAKAAGVPYSVIYVDKFDLRYPRSYRARAGRLDFPAVRGASATVRGLVSTGVVAVGVTVPAAPVWVSDLRAEPEDGGGYRVSFDSPVPEGQCWVAETSALLRADEVVAVAPSAWRAASNRADYIIITPSSMAAAAEALAEHRRSSGLASVVVPLEEIYDEFHGGLEEPEAIRTFLDWTQETWEQAPRYVLLAGLGTEDYKNFTGVAQNRVPVMLLRQAEGLFCSDLWFADPDDDGIPDVAIGRLPVISAAELSDTIEKIIRAETAGGGNWRQTMVLASDRPDNGGQFDYSSARVRDLLPRDYLARTVSVAALGFPASRTTLRDHFRDGVALVNYFGHGGMDRIAADTKTGQALLDADGIESLGNSNRLPLVTSMSCALGRFSLPNYDCLGTVLLLQTNAGASAVWAPSGQSYNQPARVLADGFYKALFRNGAARIGDAVVQACEHYVEKGQMRGLLNVYNLLGDPAMPLTGTAFLGASPSFAEWKDVAFTDEEKGDPDIGGDWADPDGDGLPNLAEYALGWNPFVADGDFEILAGKESKPEDGEDGLVIEYQRRRGVRDVNFEIEASESLSLQDWFDGSDYITEETVSDDGNGLTETARLVIRRPDESAAPRLFIRLRLQP